MGTGVLRRGAVGSARPLRRPAIAGLVAVLAIAAPLAFAKPGDLDPTFGDGGLVKLAAGDRYQAVDAPLLQPSGRIIFAGLLKNASDRVFLHAVTTNGATDPTFGTAGEVHTNSVAPQRKAATALAPDGKILVAGGSNTDGKVTIERFTANGAKDSTWGTSGRVTVNVGGSFARPTGVVGLADGSVLVAVEAIDGGRNVFTVAKVKPRGLDSTFGNRGIARVAFSGNRAATAFDLALLGDGKILLAGSVKDPAAAGADTALARLNPNGSLDGGFGTGGAVTHNLTGNAAEDYAVALAVQPDGKLVVTGPAAGVGMVARLSANGSLDSSFGTGGKVVGGLMPAGDGFAPADVVVDAADRPIVAGTKIFGSPATYGWGVVRLTPNASPVLDTSFGSSGRVVLTACQNNVGAGPTGLTPDGARILVLGACEAAARTTLVRLLGSGRAAGAVELAIAPDRGAAGHERIPLSQLDPSAAIEAAEDAQAAALRRTALRRTALRRTDIVSTALRRTALRRTGLLSTALAETALRRTLLSEIALRRTTWEELLGTDVPLQTLTLEDALAINPAGVGALTLDDIDLNSTALRRTTMAAILLGVRPLSALPQPTGGWCAFLAGKPYDCSNGVDTATTTLVDLELLGDDLSAYYATPISLRGTDLGTGDAAAPLAGFLLSELDLTISPFKDAKASEFASILNCGACNGTLADLSDAELGNATVAQLVGLLPQPSLSDVSVGDVVLAVLDRTEIPYESLDLAGLLGEADYRGDGLSTYTAGFTLDCNQAPDLSAVLAAPGDARPVPNGATASLDGGPHRPLPDGKPAQRKQGPFTFDLAPACDGVSGVHDAELKLQVEPGSVLGPIDGAQLSVRGGGTTSDSNQVTTAVDDSRDPGDELEQARPLGTDALLTGHLDSSDDSDSFSFTPGPGRTTISLSHLPEDFDLVIYGPAVGPDATALRRTALRRTALRRTAVGDTGEEPTDEAILAPDQIQDIALRRTDLVVRGSSINRGAEDEAASVVVGAGEAGTTFTAQVVGYNGASSPNPYVVRRTDAPMAPPLDCPSRSLDSNYSIPFPTNIPSSTRTLYLVDPGRMAARDGQAPTEALIAKLGGPGQPGTLAGRTDGVVVPVEGNPRVPAAAIFDAWDANPCSVERANAVVTVVNEVVDDVRAQGGGLPQLRSIVVVGPDEVIPQARVADRAVIGNESDYADDPTADRNGDGVRDDNAVSAALRAGFLLTDDAFGDFDPTESSYVPDVALGRLLETPAQVEAQVQAFLDSNGVVAPQRSFVTGYDFLSDGATEVFGSLESAVPAGAAQSRIDETWTAADAIAGANASGPGYLSINAHYDHYRALPAAAFNGTNPDLFEASQANVPAGSLAFTVGCHAGLNVAVGDASSGSDPRLGDWTEQMVTQGALYAANTGFGYGDDTAVAYSERVMADYASNLVTGDVTAGQALMLAKQAAYASVGVSDVYWTKASMEATFYGLPMYRMGADGREGDSVLPPDPSGVDPSDPTTRTSAPLSVDLRDNLHQVTGERGPFWQVDAQAPAVIQRRPIQPKLSRDVTSAANGPAHGFLLESLTTKDIPTADTAIARATIDLAAHEPEPEVTDPFFPATLATVEPQATPQGRRDILTLMAGSFRDDRQRLNLEMGGRVTHSISDDFVPPTIGRVDGLVANQGSSIGVEPDGGDLLGGNVLYVTDADKAAGGEVQWRRSELAVIAPGVLSTGGTLSSGTEISEAIVQVYDTSYNVAYSNGKVVGHTISPAAEPGVGDPRVVFSPSTPASGYYSSPPQVSLDPGQHGNAAFEVSVDGGEFKPYSGSFTITEPAEGEHLVAFRGSDGSTATSRFAVDRNPPEIVAEPDRPANAGGWYDGPVTFSFTCADAVSGVASCPQPVTLSGAGANQSVQGTATDRAGYSTTTTVNGINIDLGTPTISAQALTQPNEYGWYNAAGVTVRFSCQDDLSGLKRCGQQTVSGAPRNATHDLTVNTEGRDQRLTGTAIDLADRSATAQSPPISIDRTRPTAAISTAGGSVLIGNQRLQGTAFDALSRVRKVEVTYTNSVGQRVVENADLTCAADGSCTWTAALPPLGVWQAGAKATDFAGNTSPDTATTLITVR